jgi:ADP-heptose:LPS heptosyltransferase
VKVLFITSTRIGDAVLSTGLLSELIRSHPTIDLTIACGPAAVPIFAEIPNLNMVLSMKKRVASLHWLDLWKKCVGTRWDVIVDLRNSPVSRMLSAKSRYFMERNDASQHRVQQLGSVMGFCPPPPPRLWISGENEKVAK